jgi:hypothetical protein
MAKFTFKCESQNSDTINTIEFTTSSVHVVLQKLEQFLRSSGSDFEIDGYIGVLQPEYDTKDDEDSTSVNVFRNMSDDLIKNPPYMDSLSKIDEIKIDLDNINFDYMGNMGGSVITGGAGEDTIQSYDKIVVDLNQENCSLCKLPVNVMRMHQCFDPQCPSNAYRREYHSEK